MIEGNPQPLEIAACVLRPETLDAVRRLPDFSRRGWCILDRWALNSPDALRRLEAEGEVILLGRVLEQQRIEQRVIDLQPVDMPEPDALVIAKVQTELDGGPSFAAILAGKAQRRDKLMQAVSEASSADLEASALRIKKVLSSSHGIGKRQRLKIVLRD